MMKKYLFLILMIIPLLLPLNTYADDFYSGAYLVYYQDDALTTTHLNSYAVYYKNFYSYNANTTSFKDTWYYTTHLDTTSIQGGSIYIPYIISHQILIAGTPTYYSAVFACSGWDCTSEDNSTSCVCTSYNTPTANDYEFYDSEVSLIVRCYYNGSSNFVPGRIEGSNIICPVVSNASYLYGIRIFHRVIGATSFEYSLGLASGTTMYSSSSSSIVEAQEDTTDAINGLNETLNDDSTTNAESTGSSFFSNFTIRDFGLTSIVTAPITFIQSFTNSCSANPVVMDIYGTDVTLPCGDVIFWNRDDVASFRIIWNLLVGGPIIYALALKLFRTVQRALDPDKNDEGGLDL